LKEKPTLVNYLPIDMEKLESIGNKTFGEKCMVEYLVELLMKTTINENICELVNENLSKANFECYLKSLEWYNSICIIRFVRVKINDVNFNCLLNWIQ
jgi:hypothetical protein